MRRFGVPYKKKPKSPVTYEAIRKTVELNAHLPDLTNGQLAHFVSINFCMECTAEDVERVRNTRQSAQEGVGSEKGSGAG